MALDRSADDSERRLDVREVDSSPFSDTVIARRGLEDGVPSRVRTRAAVQYTVLEAHGFAYEPEQRGDDEWHVLTEVV